MLKCTSVLACSPPSEIRREGAERNSVLPCRTPACATKPAGSAHAQGHPSHTIVWILHDGKERKRLTFPWALLPAHPSPQCRKIRNCSGAVKVVKQIDVSFVTVSLPPLLLIQTPASSCPGRHPFPRHGPHRTPDSSPSLSLHNQPDDRRTSSPAQSTRPSSCPRFPTPT